MHNSIFLVLALVAAISASTPFNCNIPVPIDGLDKKIDNIIGTKGCEFRGKTGRQNMVVVFVGVIYEDLPLAGARLFSLEDVVTNQTNCVLNTTYSYLSSERLVVNIQRCNFSSSSLVITGGPLPPASVITISDSIFTSESIELGYTFIDFTVPTMPDAQIRIERNLFVLNATLSTYNGVPSMSISVSFGIQNTSAPITLRNVSLVVATNSFRYTMNGENGVSWFSSLTFVAPTSLFNTTVTSYQNNAEINSTRTPGIEGNQDASAILSSVISLSILEGSSISDKGSSITAQNVPRLCIMLYATSFTINGSSSWVSVDGSHVFYNLVGRVNSANPFCVVLSIKDHGVISDGAQITVKSSAVATMLDMPVIYGSDNGNAGLLGLPECPTFNLTGSGTVVLLTENQVTLQGMSGKGTYSMASVVVFRSTIRVMNSAKIVSLGNSFNASLNSSGVIYTAIVVHSFAGTKLSTGGTVLIDSEVIIGKLVVCHTCLHHIFSADLLSEFENDGGLLRIKNVTYDVTPTQTPNNAHLASAAVLIGISFNWTFVSIKNGGWIEFLENNLTLKTKHDNVGLGAMVVQNVQRFDMVNGAAIKINKNILSTTISTAKPSTAALLFLRDVVLATNLAEYAQISLESNRVSVLKASPTVMLFTYLMCGFVIFMSPEPSNRYPFSIGDGSTIKVADNWLFAEASVAAQGFVLLPNARLTVRGGIPPALAIYRNGCVAPLAGVKNMLSVGDLVVNTTVFVEACLNTRNNAPSAIDSDRVANAFPSKGRCGTDSLSITMTLSLKDESTSRSAKVSATVSTFLTGSASPLLSVSSPRALSLSLWGSQTLVDSPSIGQVDTSTLARSYTLVVATNTFVGDRTRTQFVVSESNIPNRSVSPYSVSNSVILPKTPSVRVTASPSRALTLTHTNLPSISMSTTFSNSSYLTMTHSGRISQTTSLSIQSGCPSHCHNVSILDGEGPPCAETGFIAHNAWGDEPYNKNSVLTTLSSASHIEFRGSVTFHWPSDIRALAMQVPENTSHYRVSDSHLLPSKSIVYFSVFYKGEDAVFSTKAVIRVNFSFGCEVNANPVMFTAMLLPMPAPEKVLPQPTVSAAAAASIVSVFGSAPDMQTVAILGLSPCAKGSAKTEGLALRSIAPLATESNCFGALIGNVILVGSMLLVHSITMIALKFVKALPWLRAMDAARYPSLSLTVIVFCQNGFLLCGMKEGRMGNNWGYVAATWTLVPVFSYVFLAHFCATRAFYPLVYRYQKTWRIVARIFLPMGELDQTVGGSQWVFSVVGKLRFHESYWALCPHLSFLASAPVSLGEGESCSTMYAVSIVLHVVFACIIAVKRPSRIVFSNVLQVTSLLLNAILIIHYLILLGTDAFSAPSELVQSLGIFAAFSVVASVCSFTHIVVLRLVQIMFGRLPALKPFYASCAWESATWPLVERGVTVFHAASEKDILEALKGDTSFFQSSKAQSAKKGSRYSLDTNTNARWEIELEDQDLVDAPDGSLHTKSFVSKQKRSNVPAPLLTEILTDDEGDEVIID